MQLGKWRHQEVGKRFEYRYHDHRDIHPIKRLFNLVCGISLIMIGLILVPLPGPGWPIVFLGLGAISSESLKIARFLDRLDKKFFSPLIQFAKKHPITFHSLLALAGACFLLLAWQFGPAWQLGPFHWGTWPPVK